MNYIFITGTSSGIGKALAERFLQDENNIVTGISRRSTLEHERYRHIKADLADLKILENFSFENYDNAESYTLINNAGVLGELGHIGTLQPNDLIQGYKVNMIAPAVLMNSFMKQYSDFRGKKVILNTSSGAARHTVPSWGMYCSTKAGVDMLSQVIHNEQEEAKPEHPFYVFSVAPGIIDTPMQEQIRATSKSVFQNVDRFINLWKNNELVPPKKVAENFEKIVKHPKHYSEVAIDLREL